MPPSGATTAAIDWGELYTALQQGVADGLEGPPQGMIDMKFTDFLKNYSYINIFYGLSVILINDKAFLALPKEQQDAITKAGARKPASISAGYLRCRISMG